GSAADRAGSCNRRPWSSWFGLPPSLIPAASRCLMEKFSLEARTRVLMNSAATAPAGRAAETVYGGHARALRQTLIALTAGRGCRRPRIPARRPSRFWGWVRLVADATEWEGRDG